MLAAWWPIPGFNRKFLYGIEGEALWTFEKTFGVVPICNLDVPEFFEGQQYCQGLVTIPACQEMERLITLEALAERSGRLLVHKELEPHTGVTVTFVSDDSGIGTLKTRFKAAMFLTQEHVDAETQARTREPAELSPEYEDEFRVYELALVHDVNLAAWSLDKMKEVIRLCGELKPKKTKAEVVKAFEAPFREVPKPHTWGEVALIKARMIAGSWQPGKHVWVKVMHAKDLLGEAKLNKGWYVGEDKSDLPQRLRKRPKCKDFEPKDEPVEYVQDEYEIYGLEISVSKPARAKTEKETRDKLQQAKERLWAAVEDLFQRGCSARES